MYWIAISLGFFGSLHCVGMCGPLAFAYFSGKGKAGAYNVFSTLQYQAGRVVAYMMLGLIMGLAGSIAVMGGVQKWFTIILGVVLVGLFFLSVHPDKLISGIPFFRHLYAKATTLLGNLIRTAHKVPPIVFGLMNGILPCGLVYLGIAGALAMGNIWGGMGFMLFFGLGTVPAMMLVLWGQKWISPSLRSSLRNVYPYVMLCLGMYLIYRGSMSKLPLELNFIDALRNPVMCH